LLGLFRSRHALILENAALRHRSLSIVQPETIIRWHRQGFRYYWRWKSLPKRPGRPKIPWDIRDQIRQLSTANPRWGAPRIHGELLKLGINISQASVSIDSFTIPAATFRVLYVFLVLDNTRRNILHCNVTESPTAVWAGPLAESVYGRVIASIRRECLDHLIIINEWHLRWVLREYIDYYNRSRTHLGLAKDCRVPRLVEPPGSGPVCSKPVLGGLHHLYFRRAA